MRAPGRTWLVAALGAAVVVLVGSVTAAVAATGTASGTSSTSGRETTPGSMMGGTQSGRGTSMMGGTQFGAGTSMMGGGAVGSRIGYVWLAGNGAAVTSIASGRQRAALAAAPDGLRPGEVIWFDNGFYVELKDSSGASATEVLVDAVNGAVTTEPGPAMMWNTRYGMGFAGRPASAPAITAEQARQIADRWLRDNLPGQAAESADSYPGYYTMETTADGRIVGMLSVNAATGTVWSHTWHGRFLAKEDS